MKKNKSGKVKNVLRRIGTSFKSAVGSDPKTGFVEKFLDPIAAPSDALKACSDLYELAKKVGRMKRKILGT